MQLLHRTVTIGHRAAAVLRPGATGRVLASFERVCYLVSDGGGVAALAWGRIAKGPLNVMLGARPAVHLPAGARFSVQGRALMVDDALFDLASAALWDARPEWDALRVRRTLIAARTNDARRSNDALTGRRLLQPAGLAVAAAAEAFQQAWQRGAWSELPRAMECLCGLGPGLTPAGDDWLAGWLLGQRLAPNPMPSRALPDHILGFAAARTTVLACAFLACAAAGEADETWHALLAALAGDPTIAPSIARPIAGILSCGASSGAAMLAGFFAGLELPGPGS